MWHADELFVVMRNGADYRKNQSIAFLWNVMDRRTRFLLASKLSSLRDRKGALHAFVEARKNAQGNYPDLVITDALKSYGGVPYARATGWNPKHLSKAGIGKPHATNNRLASLYIEQSKAEKTVLRAHIPRNRAKKSSLSIG